jgi:predicted O-methyltransferase YrrM|tara:strand:- start:7345 stop:7878 length:534 start_codon:yes stop_codon:yes gene_type:complete
MKIPSHGKYEWLPKLYDAVSALKPKTIIEFGPASGVTTITMAQALKDNNIDGKIKSYDIWDDSYWGSQWNCQINIDAWAVRDYVQLNHLDFYDWIKEPEQFDFMYFDVNNNGNKLEDLNNCVREQINMGGSVVYFEGGSVERDKYVQDGFKKMNDVKSEIGYEVLTENVKYSLSRIS